MGLSKVTQYIGIRDLKIYPITTDVEGQEMVFGTAIDCPGVKGIKSTKKTIVKTNTGDSRRLGRFEKVESVEISFSNGKISLDQLALINGGTLVSSGTTPNQQHAVVETGDQVGASFKMQYASFDADDGVGDVHRIYYKVNGTMDIEDVEDDFAKFTFKGEAIPANGQVTIGEETFVHPLTALIFNETVVEIT